MLISDGLYMSQSTFGRTYLIASGDVSVMFDTFVSSGVRTALREFEEQDRIDLSTLRALCLTHNHYDHAGGAAYVRARFGVPVICHPLDAEPIVQADHLMIGEMRWLDVHEHVPAFPMDHLVEDGDTVEIGPIRLEVVHLPGHTRGGVAYRWGDYLVSGDTVLPGGVIGWNDVHWGSNLPDLADTIRRLMGLGPVTICGGHGEPFLFTEEVAQNALANVKRIWDAGQAAKVSKRAPMRPDDAPRRTLVVNGQPKDPELPLGRTQDDLRLLPQYEVKSGNLAGTIRPIGHHHGLILCGEGNEPITAPLAATMNLEHYCETGRCGVFTPRNDVAQSFELAPESVTVRFGPIAEWAVTSEVRYERRDDAAFDVTFRFEFGQDYPRFEAFIASYFWGKRIPYVLAGGVCFRPEIKKGQQLFFPRDDDARTQVGDGRWDFLKRGTLFAEADPAGRFYDAPVTIHRDDDTGWTFVQMVDRRLCAAVSVNTFAYAQDFSLVGRDVKAGERIDVRARVVYRKLDAPEEARGLQEEFQREIESTETAAHG